MLASFAPMTFLGNHDVTRIATKIADPDAPRARAGRAVHRRRHPVDLLPVTSRGSGAPSGTGPAGTTRCGQPSRARPAELSPIGAPVLELHQRLIALRRRHAWLHHARLSVEHVTNDQIVYRCSTEAHAIVVALNLAAYPAVVPVAGAGDVLAGHADLDRAAPTAQATLPAGGWVVLSG